MVVATAPSATDASALDAVVERVKEGSRAFVRLSLEARMQLVEQMRRGYHEVAEASVVDACRAKGIDPDGPQAGEEWMTGPFGVIRNLRLLHQSLKDILETGAPRLDARHIKTLPDGRLSVRVFPTSALDAMLLMKTVVDAHLKEGITAANLKEHQAAFYRHPHGGRLCVVLGGGNINAIPPTDLLQKLFVEGTACILKMNPVNAYLGPHIERAFRSAIERGYLAVVYGGVAEGERLVNHPLVDEVHMTGSDKTYDLMVWGPPGPEREARKQKDEPLLKKDFSAELGNISPIIVMPGPYSPSELSFQARSLAGTVVHNASFNCNAGKLLVTPQGWETEGALLDALAKGMARVPTRKAYYPGAEQRFKQFTDGRAGLRLVGAAKPGELPYALVTHLDPSATHDRAFTTEPWCSVLSHTALPAKDPVEYLQGAVKFLNEKVWGTLCASIVVHPATLKDARVAQAVEQALRDLRYGTVAVNCWPAAAFALMCAPWGGHPTASRRDIQSGLGVVHNTFMLEGVEKCVMRAPVKVYPVPPWYPGHRAGRQLGRQLTELEWNQSWLRMAAVAAAAVRA